MASLFALPNLLQQSLQTNFATPEVQPLPDVMSGVNRVFANNAALGAQQAQRPHGFMNILGMLGDALAMASGAKTGLYRQQLDRQQQGAAMQGFLTDPATAIQKLIGAGADIGDVATLYKAMTPSQNSNEILDAMNAAGIDPASDEGKQLIESHFGKQPGASVQDYEYAKQQGYTGSFPEFLRNYVRNPIVIGSPETGYGTLDVGGGSNPQPIPTVKSAQEAISKYPPGTIVQAPDGRRFKVPGGAGGNASGGFPK